MWIETYGDNYAIDAWPFMRGEDMMDEMKLNLGSRWMRKLASKLIVRYIKKQFEVNAELDLDELKISYVDGDVIIKTELELRMDAKESKKILSKLEED